LWELGFRPFYLLAAAFAALSIPLWALQFSGLLPGAWLQGPLWHAHEMVFGYTLAVVVGFLFTAGRNWSGQPTPTGRPLMALAALWVAARVLVLTPWGGAAALANVAFALLAAWGLWRALRAGGNRRNYFFVGLLCVLAVANAALHLSQLGWWQLPRSLGVPVALDVLLFIIAVMAGRVLPMFTNNGVPGAGAIRQPRLEQAALGVVLALAVADLAGLAGLPLALLLGGAAVLHAARLALWRPWRTARAPLVWVLHGAYAWIVLHLALRAAAALALLPATLAVHALTAGAIGSLTLGMMTRTARGHLGLPLQADAADVACYALVAGAAGLRVFVPLAWPAALIPAVLASALLWSAAFGLYALRYAPRLARPRVDGRPG
jgi:uncharacterized protein involved in response to NO